MTSKLINHVTINSKGGRCEAQYKNNTTPVIQPKLTTRTHMHTQKVGERREFVLNQPGIAHYNYFVDR